LNVVNLLPPGFQEAALREDTRAGLTGTPKSLPPKWFFDLRSNAQYEKIAKLPEYRQARIEHAILRDMARSIAALTEARTLIELRSGPSDRTSLLLRALRAEGTLESYVGVDASESLITAAGKALTAEYPELAVRLVVANVEEHLGLPGYPAGGPRLVAFLGSAIGNMIPAQRAAFLARVRSRLRPGDAFLLGADLAKDPDTLVAAYHDSDGISAAFDKNVLAMLNSHLGANFDVNAFDHIAAWVPETESVERRLRSAVEQEVALPGAGLTVRLTAGEEIRTGISTKFHRDGMSRELAMAGLAVRAWRTDPSGRYGVSLSVPL